MPIWRTDGPTRLHFIGDSLTRGQGAESVGGYRLELVRLLKAAGKDVTTTGYRADTPGPDRWSGDGGWRIDEYLAPGLRNRVGLSGADMVRGYPADIICVMLGTNDIGSITTPNATLAERYGDLLDQWNAVNPSAHIFVACPIPHQLQPWGGTTNYSTALRSMLDARIAAGKPYHVVTGMDTIAGAENYSDPIHLSEAGYKLMASKWASALLAADSGST